MSPEEQRIKISDWCGWRLDYDTTQLKSFWISPKSGYAYQIEDGFIPDYLNDLNAMHEAEMRLTDMEYDVYFDHLVKTGRTVRATAAQRAEALLRTIGKWKD